MDMLELLLRPQKRGHSLPCGTDPKCSSHLSPPLYKGRPGGVERKKIKDNLPLPLLGKEGRERVLDKKGRFSSPPFPPPTQSPDAFHKRRGEILCVTASIKNLFLNANPFFLCYHNRL